MDEANDRSGREDVEDSPAGARSPNTGEGESGPAQTEETPAELMQQVEEQTRTQSRSNKTFFLIGGLVVVLLLVACIVPMVAGALLFTMRSETTTAPTVQAVQVVEPRAAAITAPTPPVVVATPEGGRDHETAVYSNIYSEVNPSVVNVTVLSASSSIVPEGSLPPEVNPEGLLPVSSGSGFVWDLDGYIVTNNHVVEQAEELQITFADGTMAIAEVVGTDRDSDLAVLHIDAEGYDLKPVRLGNLDDVYVGMRVAAIGNPFGLEGTLTTGIVSAVGRTIPARERFSIPDSIQTDAAINPGNSGGPLLNEEGEVVGVNAQIRSEVNTNSGVGFAIPISVVKRVIPVLIETGEYQHSYIGVSGNTLSPICADALGLPQDLRGAVIGDVLPDTPAAAAGLRGGEEPSETRYPSICPTERGGDVVIAIDGQSVTRFDDLLAYLASETSPGDTVTLTLWREDGTEEVDVTLAPRPESM